MKQPMMLLSLLVTIEPQFNLCTYYSLYVHCIKQADYLTKMEILVYTTLLNPNVNRSLARYKQNHAFDEANLTTI